ncbi:anhydro-N-acetylmuramic acid kinase [Brevibacillus humidisoli]|uniref:anhydro-N-acetylmuramic acid kinase n=1 Tax=Brevibacillus humidisoli TaxID=2895522 RepID=UPI001E39808C|nr:anhydro-N-acetylmuramic acid kinase [Brevibacillus humidisoli]UFJ40829.1 anhydro-N-acetylmuramic acid kinase [Brevibacillus humidisoli]
MSIVNRRDWRLYREKQEHLLVGLMSGTSLDGVDAALVSIHTDAAGEIEKTTLQAFHYVPYGEELRKRLLALCNLDTARLDELVVAHFGLAEWYAYAVRQLLEQAGVSSDQVDAVCVHGQTVWHIAGTTPFPGPQGEMPVRASLQIGELSTLAERIGIPVIGNFRARDLAAGGEGAPLVPYADLILFRDPQKGRLLQNIGGIGNVTVIPAAAGLDQIYAFDTGPGNMLIDELVNRETGGRERFDASGRIASAGRVCEELLHQFLQDEYYQMPPPKSTGREVYGRGFADRFVSEGEKLQLAFADLIATATALTARTITDAYRQHVFPQVNIKEVIVSGGGAHNLTLLEMMRRDLPSDVTLTTTAEYGVPDDAKEAVAFAILGHETLMDRPSNVPSVTGASRPVILGNVCW